MGTRTLHDFKVNVDPFGAVVYFYTDEEKLQRAVKKRSPLTDLEPLDAHAGCTYQVSPLQFHVGVFDGTLNCITHECLHVVMSLMEEVGVDPKCQETYCYTLGTLVDKAFAGYVKVAKERAEKREAAESAIEDQQPEE